MEIHNKKSKELGTYCWTTDSAVSLFCCRCTTKCEEKKKTEHKCADERDRVQQKMSCSRETMNKTHKYYECINRYTATATTACALQNVSRHNIYIHEHEQVIVVAVACALPLFSFLITKKSAFFFFVIFYIG